MLNFGLLWRLISRNSMHFRSWIFVSNLTWYKLFIGDDKRNMLFGVTFSFKKIRISQPKRKVLQMQLTLPKMQFLSHLACNQKQLNTADGVHAQNKADHFPHDRNCGVCWKRSAYWKHIWLRCCLFRLWFSFINKTTQFGQALHVLINNCNTRVRPNLFKAATITNSVKKPVVLPTLDKQNTLTWRSVCHHTNIIY